MQILRCGFCFCILFYTFITSICYASFIKMISQDVSFQRSVASSGFHRMLLYNVTVKGTNKETHILIEEKFPKDIYVDPYQLLKLIESNKIKIIPDTQINTELPAYEAKPFSIQFCSSSRNNFHYVELPIHLRYQKPHQCNIFGGFVHVNLGAPDVYVTSKSHYSSDINSICPPDKSEIGSWLQIATKELQTGFEVPVGCTEHLYPVLFSTVIVIGLSALYICSVLNKVNKA